MRLSPDYVLTTLADLERVVGLEPPKMTFGATFGEDGKFQKYGVVEEELEMSTDQYVRYTQLVFESDPIRRFRGMKIKLSTAPTEQKGDGSV